MRTLPLAVRSLSADLLQLGWVPDLLVAGSLALGDYVPGVSDLDLVAVVDGPIDELRAARLIAIHRDLDRGEAAATDLGCVYVEQATLTDVSKQHFTWTHGGRVDRTLSAVTRAELVRHGFAVHGRSPSDLLPPMTEGQVHDAARAELSGYWASASRRPWWWVNPIMVDLGLTSMARGRAGLEKGGLISKSDAIGQAHAPQWLIDQMRARRQGQKVVSPRLRAGWIAWRDARSTVRLARRNRRNRA